MDPAKPQIIKWHPPVITLLLLAGGIIPFVIPDLGGWLVYDRQAILSGEFWRVFTGHWVHFSASHLFYDALAVGVTGWICERQKLPYYGWLCLLAPWFIGAVLLVFEPRMTIFGGLSALAASIMIYLTLWGLQEPGPWRWICLATLTGFAAKTVFELATGHMFFVRAENIAVKVSVASHLAGAVFAGLFYGWVKLGLQKTSVKTFTDSG